MGLTDTTYCDGYVASPYCSSIDWRLCTPVRTRRLTARADNPCRRHAMSNEIQIAWAQGRRTGCTIEARRALPGWMKEDIIIVSCYVLSRRWSCSTAYDLDIWPIISLYVAALSCLLIAMGWSRTSTIHLCHTELPILQDRCIRVH